MAARGWDLAICREIVRVLQGSTAPEDRLERRGDAPDAARVVVGLDATVRLPLAPPVDTE
ncbi:hypothetical protein [Xylophilus ampelinus]|uniref:Uncharacterized protein n=1 Tax=Xylophilus ampelinus TaxID=54067 RepID=A0A318SCW9_9BURK|nr:hypothetical protein [Xylophilus ampelinus]MCS4511445.1 hypothetical protein [Xylophilus ampelinus]PYE74857.1 hypothetical protein DFQ15_12458 [Xylophilus ampelinus]